MDDLISRAAALDAIDCWHIDFNSMDGAKVQTDCWRTIKELPAVDAVPVVRCRNCRWFDKANFVCNNDLISRMIGDCGCYPNFNVDLDWFCANGERRDDDGADA